MVTFARDILQKGTGGSAIPDFQKLWDHAPYTKIEWIFQVVDNCYTSSLFLWQLWVGRSREKQSGRVDSFAYIFVTNLYFEIICVLLATIWAVKTHAEVEGRQNHTYPSVSSMSYRSGETREIVITRDIDITTSASVELNDLSKEQWRHK
ncbi:hypothetical protein VNI00_008380 [Paramarasmius palmivorus]|uniref:Uncharacterized protein n=1 Tax=Paramarasmius palmivorus TaxID=297713 RepID=A0AAW0CYN1_9AGAR